MSKDYHILTHHVFLLCWMISVYHFAPKKLFWVEMPGHAQVTPRMTDGRSARLCFGFVGLASLLNPVISHVIIDKDFRLESVSCLCQGRYERCVSQSLPPCK